MNELAGLGSLGFELPSLAYIAGAVIFSLVGWVAFGKGRKASRSELTWTGAILMVYPYAVSQTWLLWIVGFALSAWLYLKWD